MYRHLYHILLTILLGLISAQSSVAQTDVAFTQFDMATSYYNPAAIGRTDFVSITGAGRLQWIGVDNAPMNFAAMADMPFKFIGKRWGTGVVLSQEKIGLFNNVNVGAQLAYKHRLLGGTIGIGLRLGLANRSFQGSKVVIPDNDDAHSSNDDAIPTQDVGGSAFDADAGLFYEHRLFYLGLSGTHLSAPTINLKTDQNAEERYEFHTKRNYYLVLGSNIPIKNTLFLLQPSVLIATDAQQWHYAANLRTQWRKFITAGVGYRHGEAISALVGVEMKGFTIGYAYDYPLTSIARSTSGSHELFVNYRLKLNMGNKSKYKQKSIRIL